MTQPTQVRRRALQRTALLGACVFVGVTAAVAVIAFSFRDDGSTVRTTAGLTAADQTLAAPDTSSVVDSSASATETTVAPTPSSTRRRATTTAVARTTTSEPETTTTQPIFRPRPCPELDGSAIRVTKFADAPPVCLDPKASYSAVIVTSEGEITVALDQRRAPNTVNNFVYLSRYHFYDGLIIHRIVPDFILQGGDPLGNGQGGPGYEFADELPEQSGYPVGALAMANSGPNTNGSQFFIVTGPIGLDLPGGYSRFGRVTKGLAVVKAINDLGVAPAPDLRESPPKRRVTIASITITATGEDPKRVPALSSTSTTTEAA